MNKLIEKDKLIKWLEGEKYGYFLNDGKTWINYGSLDDKFPYNEENKQWELSRNRMIDKIINLLLYGDINDHIDNGESQEVIK